MFVEVLTEDEIELLPEIKRMRIGKEPTLTAVPLGRPRVAPAWNFRYRLSVEAWAKMAYATRNTDTAAADAPGTE